EEPIMATEGATIVMVEGDGPAASVEAAIARREHDAALTLCAQQHGPAIGRLCMALVGSQADAEDLTQETLLAAHDAFDSWRGEGTIRSWLFGIARRKCARHLETRTAGRAKLELLRDEPPAPDPADTASDRQLAARGRRLRRAGRSRGAPRGGAGEAQAGGGAGHGADTRGSRAGTAGPHAPDADVGLATHRNRGGREHHDRCRGGGDRAPRPRTVRP